MNANLQTTFGTWNQTFYVTEKSEGHDGDIDAARPSVTIFCFFVFGLSPVTLKSLFLLQKYEIYLFLKI